MAASALEPIDTARVPPIVGWLGLVFAVVVVGAVLWGVPHQQDDLTARTQQAIATAGYRGVDVEFNGRDAALRGEVAGAADADAVAAVVRDVTGVRSVDAARLVWIAHSRGGGE